MMATILCILSQNNLFVKSSTRVNSLVASFANHLYIIYNFESNSPHIKGGLCISQRFDAACNFIIVITSSSNRS